MDIGCQLPMQGPVATRDALVTFARQAEGLGMASLWVSDHVIFPYTSSGYPGGRFPHPPEKPYLEPVTLLAAAAMCTTKARLGASVFVLGHRHPVLMAKMLTTIDTLSNGRLICGVGVGWWKQELEILGAPFASRGKQADEMLRLQELWTSDRPAFDGEFYRFSDIGFAPKVRSRIRPSGSAAIAPAPFAASSRSATDGTRRARPRGDAGRHRAPARRRRYRRAPVEITDDLAATRPQRRSGSAGRAGVTDLFGEYQRLGLAHLMVDFRRDDLGRMLELLDLVATKVRPAVAA
jgi:alkanesulfonate monooxygenase SsuD/methylene tetrahydromethanopterin reductase-like flavin-dependent oxidoreductase (luciferase family)